MADVVPFHDVRQERFLEKAFEILPSSLAAWNIQHQRHAPVEQIFLECQTPPSLPCAGKPRGYTRTSSPRPRKFVMLSELSIWELLPMIYKSHFSISPRTVS